MHCIYNYIEFICMEIENIPMGYVHIGPGKCSYMTWKMLIWDVGDLDAGHTRFKLRTHER